MSEQNAMRFAEAMNDDFNTPVALSVLFELANEVNKTKSAVLARQLKGLAALIGLLQRVPQEFLRSDPASVAQSAYSEAMIEERIAARAAAKKSKKFDEADRIRAELLANGIILEDKPGGITEWRRA
jgi:cysteinyl-tRNA synthetase